MTSIEQEIKKIIEDTIGGKYIGRLSVEREDYDNEPSFWSLCLYLEMELTPIILACQGTEDEFKKFIQQEIRTRKLEGVSFWKAEREIIENDDYYE